MQLLQSPVLEEGQEVQELRKLVVVDFVCMGHRSCVESRSVSILILSLQNPS